jgi:hypothetical protein
MVFNRTYQQRARRSARLQGEQLDISFPHRGRPSRIRVLERCGQLRLSLCDAGPLKQAERQHTALPQRDNFDPDRQLSIEEVYDPEFAAQLLGKPTPYIPPMTEDELAAEFDRLFPPEL